MKEDNRDKDFFYHREDQKDIVWTYFNPDSTAGGQYVESIFGYDLILEAEQEATNYEDFFMHIHGLCKQYLIDKDSEGFECYDTGEPWGKATFTGYDESAMIKIIELTCESKGKRK